MNADAQPPHEPVLVTRHVFPVRHADSDVEHVVDKIIEQLNHENIVDLSRYDPQRAEIHLRTASRE
jgi:hypothetical protein